MRIDKYLKVSRLIKRRTVAKEAGDTGRVMLNGKLSKPGDRVKVGDIIELTMGQGTLKVKVLMIAETVKKDDAKLMYEVLE